MEEQAKREHLQRPGGLLGGFCCFCCCFSFFLWFLNVFKYGFVGCLPFFSMVFAVVVVFVVFFFGF